MALPIPAPLPPWTKTLIQIGVWTLSEALQFGLTYIGQAGDVTGPNPGTWRHVQVVVHDTADADTANWATCGFDLAKVQGGSVVDDWTDGDFTTAHTQLALFFDYYKGGMQSRARVKEYRFYRMNFNPLPPAGTDVADDDPYAPSGPPERIFAGTAIGNDSALLPPQCAISVTEKTPFPKHWGRTYLPFPGASNVGPKGMLTALRAQGIADNLGVVYANLQAAELFPVVPVTQVDKQPARGLVLVDHVQVDDVFDVIRRRRTHSASTRAIYPGA